MDNEPQNTKEHIVLKKLRGFTIVELLVIITIIAILISLLLPGFHTGSESVDTKVFVDACTRADGEISGNW